LQELFSLLNGERRRRKKNSNRKSSYKERTHARTLVLQEPLKITLTSATDKKVTASTEGWRKSRHCHDDRSETIELPLPKGTKRRKAEEAPIIQSASSENHQRHSDSASHSLRAWTR